MALKCRYDPCIAEWMLCPDKNPSDISANTIAESRHKALFRAMAQEQAVDRARAAQAIGGGAGDAPALSRRAKMSMRDLCCRCVFRDFSLMEKLQVNCQGLS